VAHELNVKNGKASMFYWGDVPWHGLGTALNGPATSAEAIKAAQLDWKVLKVPLCALDKTGSAKVPDYFATVPEYAWGEQGCPVFGVVGRDYKLLQNTDAFRFFDSIVGMGAAIYHTAGALRNGSRVWVLAKLPSCIRVVGDDLAEKYLLLSNGHDGHTAIRIKFTPVRVVCQNTLTRALKAGPTASIAHKPDMPRRLDKAKETLGIINAQFKTMEQDFQRMARMTLTDELLASYLAAVFPAPPPTPGESRMAESLRERALFDREQSARLAVEGKGNDVKNVRNTLWAAYNGVTEYVDHLWGKFKPKTDRARRLNSLWFGRGHQMKSRAYEQAVAMLDASRN